MTITIQDTVALLNRGKDQSFGTDMTLAIFSHYRGVSAKCLEECNGSPISSDLPWDIHDMERVFGLIDDLVQQTSHSDVQQKLLNSGWFYSNLLNGFSKAYFIMWIYKHLYKTNPQHWENFLEIISQADDNGEYQQLLTIESVCDWSDWKIVTCYQSLAEQLSKILGIVTFAIDPLEQLLPHKDSVVETIQLLLSDSARKGVISESALYHLVCFLTRTNEEVFFISQSRGYSGWYQVYRCAKFRVHSESTISSAHFQFDPSRYPDEDVSITFGSKEPLELLLTKLQSI